MMEYGRKSGKIFTVACLTIIFVFFAAVMCRVATRQLVVKKLGIRNNITAAIFFDAPKLNQLENQQKEGDSREKNVVIDWMTKYPFGDAGWGNGKLISKYEGKVDSVKKKICDYTGEFFPGRMLFSRATEKQNALLQWKYSKGISNDDMDVLFMQNGYLTYVQPRESEASIKEIGDSLADFKVWLAERNIPLLYVNAGSKVNPDDKQLTAWDMLSEYTNENGDALQEYLVTKGVDYIDMRQEMKQAGLDWYAAYYKVDHHWTTETGMWAAGVIAEKLNKDYGFAFDKEFFDRNNYTADTYAWKGGQWRSAHATSDYDCPREAYTYYLPDFPTLFSVEIPTRSIRWQGEYQDTLINMPKVMESREYSETDLMYKPDAYNINATWHNDDVGIFKNLMPVDNHKKLLVLQDSFGFYLTTYLACDVQEVHVLHLLKFDGSLRAYIEEIKPDMVIVLYCARNIKKINWANHKAAFDFR